MAAKFLVTFLTAILATDCFAIGVKPIPVTTPDLPPELKLRDRENLFIKSWRVRGMISIRHTTNAVVRGLDTLRSNLTFDPNTMTLTGDVYLNRSEFCGNYHGHVDYIKDGNVTQVGGEGHICAEFENIRGSNIHQPARYCPVLQKLQLAFPDDLVDVTTGGLKVIVRGLTINGEPSDGNRFEALAKEHGYPLSFAFARAILNSNGPESFVEQSVTSYFVSVFTRD